MISFTIGGRLNSKSNDHTAHWSQRHRKSRNERDHACYATLTAFRSKLRQDPSCWFFEMDREVVRVRLIRCSPRKLDDDNLRDAFKSIRDGIADQFGVADNHKRLVFEYAQEAHKDARRSHVRIEISDVEARGSDPSRP